MAEYFGTSHEKTGTPDERDIRSELDARQELLRQALEQQFQAGEAVRAQRARIAELLNILQKTKATDAGDAVALGITARGGAADRGQSTTG